MQRTRTIGSGETINGGKEPPSRQAREEAARGPSLFSRPDTTPSTPAGSRPLASGNVGREQPSPSGNVGRSPY